MNMRTMAANSKRPSGKYRMPPIDKDSERRVRIVTDCREEGPWGGVPAYDVHVIPSVYRAGEKDKLVCIEAVYPGECAKIVLPDGTNYHKHDTMLQPVIAVWNYADQQLQIIDLSFSMWKSLIRFQKRFGDVRTYDWIFEYEDGKGTVGKQRALTPQMEKAPLAVEVQTYVEQYLPTIEAEYWPKVTAEEIADFVKGTLTSSPSTNVVPPRSEATSGTIPFVPPAGTTTPGLPSAPITDTSGLPVPPKPPSME